MAELKNSWRREFLPRHWEMLLRGYELFEHQLEAIQLGAAGNDFVVTSGTGSGKSLTYIAAIFDHLFKSGNPMPNGVTAVIVYPLNALVNSQEEELRRYAENYQHLAWWREISHPLCEIHGAGGQNPP